VRDVPPAPQCQAHCKRFIEGPQAATPLMADTSSLRKLLRVHEESPRLDQAGDNPACEAMYKQLALPLVPYL